MLLEWACSYAGRTLQQAQRQSQVMQSFLWSFVWEQSCTMCALHLNGSGGNSDVVAECTNRESVLHRSAH